VTVDGTWVTQTFSSMFSNDGNYLRGTQNDGAVSVEYLLPFAAGSYDLELFFFGRPGYDSAVRVVLFDGLSTSTELVVDMSVFSFNWRPLGQFQLFPYATLTIFAGPSLRTVVDALRVLPAPLPSSSPAASISPAVSVSPAASVSPAPSPDLSFFSLAIGDSLIIDSETSPLVSVEGTWTQNSFALLSVDGTYLTGAAPDAVSVIMQLPLLEGRYQISIRYIPSTNRATNVPIQITTPTTQTSRFLNQQQSSSDLWNVLGEFYFDGTGVGQLTVSTAQTDGIVVVDAFRLTGVTTKKQSLTVATTPTGSVRVGAIRVETN